MHFLNTKTSSLSEAEAAVDLAQTPADILFLSFSDSDLAMVGTAAKNLDETLSTLRLANLARLQHPFSIDLYIEKTASKARFILVRLLGGCDYWRYGVDEMSRLARTHNIYLAIIPGDDRQDIRCEEASTLPAQDLQRLWAYFQYGGPENIENLLTTINNYVSTPRTTHEPKPIANAAVFPPCCYNGDHTQGNALIIFYRSFMLAGNTAPIAALGQALAARKLGVTSIYVGSLKDVEAASFVEGLIAENNFDIVLNTTAFSARLDNAASSLEAADVPQLQAIFSNGFMAQWDADPRGLRPPDLAMNVVLPEMDGRIITRAIAFKAEAERFRDLEFTRLDHQPEPTNIDYVADLAANWVRLRKTPPAERKLALILSDYPAKGGRTGYAVGLDTAKSVESIATTLRHAGYDIGTLPASDHLMRLLEDGAPKATLSLADYHAALALMPTAFSETLTKQWGTPETDDKVEAGFFQFAVLHANNLLIALQPERGAKAARKAHYHDAALAPRHSYLAFYIWLRQQEKIHALIHCGTHGTLEWLPGKAVALNANCAPQCVLGPTPVIYPFIVNNPGEAAQAKRRIAAVTIGHMTPPLITAQSHGAAMEIESLIEEFSSAQALDPKRAKRLAQAILKRAQETGLLQDCGAKIKDDPLDVLSRLDAWLCDLKEMRISQGLHVFGQAPITGSGPEADPLTARCGAAEQQGLLKALDGHFVAPGPGGAPSRGRLDVLPTGRNLYGADPRATPTRTAWEIGKIAAFEVTTRYVQDHGDWPRTIVMDLWASATLRTGGDDLAQALALIGVKPVWDHASNRVIGFEIIPEPLLERPRVDVTLRISGLFRDLFLAQINLFDQASQAVAELEEDEEINPLAGERRRSGHCPHRIFGAAPQVYGLGLMQEVNADPSLSKHALGELYLAASGYAYGLKNNEGLATRAFAERVANADAFIHVQDQAEQDLLDADAMVEHEGGFAAAANSLGNQPELYHVTTTDSASIKVRTLREEVARVIRGRVGNPRWIAGQMQHGHRGAAEIAETIDNLFALALLTEAVTNAQFEWVFDAICGTDDVRDFLVRENPRAAGAIAQRFEAALTRGLWQDQRNSTQNCLAEMQKAPR